MAVIFDQALISQIQQANDIEDIVSEHVSLKKKGREMVGLCPFHDDHRPSMYVNPVKQIFKCFACGAGGDVFKFIQMRENLSFPQAVERLAERAGIKVQQLKKSISETDQQSTIDPNQLARINSWAAKYFKDNLENKEKGKSARQYLKNRNINDESIKKWQLGLSLNSQNDLAQTAEKKRIPTNLLIEGGFLNTPGQDKFVNRLMFTIVDVTGRIIGFGGRTLSDVGAKYINSPTTPLFNKSNTLYGLYQGRHKIVETSTAIVVEGYTDVIMAHQFGFSNVVATLGTSFTTGHGKLLRRYAKQIILVFDSDTAGIAAANRALEVCLSQHIDIKLAFVPEGKDPCDFLISAGYEKFDELIENATDVLEFKWATLTEQFKADQTIAGRKQALEEFLNAVATGLASGNVAVLETGLIVNRLSSITSIRTKQLNAELSNRIKRIRKSAQFGRDEKNTAAIDYGNGLAAAAQREVIEVLLNDAGLYDFIRDKISVEDFSVPVLKEIAQVLFVLLSEATTFSIKDILSRVDSVQIANFITELESTSEKKGNYKARLVDAIEAIQRCRTDVNETESRRTNKYKLKNIEDNSSSRNRHSVGLVE